MAIHITADQRGNSCPTRLEIKTKGFDDLSQCTQIGHINLPSTRTVGVMHRSWITSNVIFSGPPSRALKTVGFD
jgi:hypothetical protein